MRAQGSGPEPVRTCIACRARRPKAELVRLVYDAESASVRVDEQQRLPGRGAYVCRAAACWRAGSRRGLSRALRVDIRGDQSTALPRAFSKGVK